MRTCHSWHDNIVFTSKLSSILCFVFCCCCCRQQKWLLMWRTKRTTMEHKWNDDTFIESQHHEQEEIVWFLMRLPLCRCDLFTEQPWDSKSKSNASDSSYECHSLSSSDLCGATKSTHRTKPQRQDYAWNTFENNHGKMVTYFMLSLLFTSFRNEWSRRAAECGQDQNKQKLKQRPTTASNVISDKIRKI